MKALVPRSDSPRNIWRGSWAHTEVHEGFLRKRAPFPGRLAVERHYLAGQWFLRICAFNVTVLLKVRRRRSSE